MADTEFIVAITLIIVGAFYIVERLIHLAVMLYQWYIGGETERYDVEGNTSQPPGFGGEKTEDLNYWWKIRCAQERCSCLAASVYQQREMHQQREIYL